MKGYIEHIITTSDKMKRELEREHLEIEIPYLADTYEMWMQTNDNKEENTSKAYISYIKSADKEFFLYEDDFFYLLPQKIKANDFDGVISLFEHYLAIINEWYEDSRKKDVGIPTKKISDWRCAFQNYQKFIIEWLIPTLKNNINEKDINLTIKVPECKRLFAEEDFFNWLVDKDNPDKIGQNSAQSYISRLKRLNRVISEKFSITAKKEIDAFKSISELLNSGKGENVLNLLDKIDSKLVQKIKAKDESLMPIKALRDSISALRSYKKFIFQEFITEIPDEEEVYEKETSDNINSEIIIYEYEPLVKNFQWRLFTQNRMSKNKDIFFPIGIIRQLFYRSQKESKKLGISNGNSDWLLKWSTKCIEGINIITDKGKMNMGKHSEFSTLTINTQTKDVVINFTDNRETAHVLTYTDNESELPIPMKIDNLKDIHIDHTPLISKVLSDNISKLPALLRLTEIIKNTANQNNINITTKNFTKIGQKVLNNASNFTEMERLIPALKEELELIRKSSNLQLMAKEYNLKKKEALN